MQKLFLVLASAVLLFSACNRDDNNTNVNPTPTNKYYFNFKADGGSRSLSYPIDQYLSSDPYRAGGYQGAGTNGESIEMAFAYSNLVTDADIRALAGRTLLFSDTAVRPSLQYDSSFTSDSYYSVDTNSSIYNIKVNTVNYLKQDTTIFNVVDVYEIKGTCRALLSNGTKTLSLTDGDFFTVISRVKN
jgi:hypothetical protein